MIEYQAKKKNTKNKSIDFMRNIHCIDENEKVLSNNLITFSYFRISSFALRPFIVSARATTGTQYEKQSINT